MVLSSLVWFISCKWNPLGWKLDCLLFLRGLILMEVFGIMEIEADFESRQCSQAHWFGGGTL